MKYHKREICLPPAFQKVSEQSTKSKIFQYDNHNIIFIVRISDENRSRCNMIFKRMTHLVE